MRRKWMDVVVVLLILSIIIALIITADEYSKNEKENESLILENDSLNMVKFQDSLDINGEEGNTDTFSKEPSKFGSKK